MPSYLSQVLARLISVPMGGINSMFGLFVGTMQKGFQSAIQFHKEGIAFARDMGMSARQAQAYTNTLIQRTEVLANRYGVSAEAIMQVQRGLSEATGKQLLLNDAQAEGFVQIDKLMGAQARSRFTEEIMNGMGGQIDTVQGAMAKVYATAAKQGLNAKKLSDKVAQNLSMANRLSFRNGIDGITRMAALSERLGINMQSVESAANQFLELDKAIEHSAHMQMLGGSAAAMFGNPLTASYEANYDPEVFAKRMSDSLASYATFDAQKGISNINGMNMDFVRAIGQAMGISAEDAAKMAKKQAEVRYKERQFTPQLERYGLNEDQRNYLVNNGQVRNGELFYTDAKGNEHNVSRGDIDATLLDEIRKFEGMSDKDIMIEQSRTLISIDEHIEGAATKVAASFAEGINQYLPDIGKQIQTLGDFFADYAKQWGDDTGKVVGKAMAWINSHGPEIKTVADAILKGLSGLVSLVGEYTKTAIGLFLGWKLLGIGTLLGNMFRGMLGGGKGVNPTANPRTTTAPSPTTSPTPTAPTTNGASSTIKKTIGRDGKTYYSQNGRRISAAKAQSIMAQESNKGIFGRLANSKVARGLAKGGKFIGKASPWAAILGFGGDYLLDNLTSDESKNSNWYAGSKATLGAVSMAGTGAMIGSLLGPIGTAIGGLLGGVYGAYSGWKDAKEAAEAANYRQEFEHHAQGGIVGEPKTSNLPIGNTLFITPEYHAQGGVIGEPKPNNSLVGSNIGNTLFITPEHYAQGGIVKERTNNTITENNIRDRLFINPEYHAQGGVVGETSTSSTPIGNSINNLGSTIFITPEYHAQGGVVGEPKTSNLPIGNNINNVGNTLFITPEYHAQGGVVGEPTTSNSSIKDSIGNFGNTLFVNTEYHAQGGVVGGHGGTDTTPAMLTPGEIVLSETMQKNLVSILKNPPIQVKPVGEREYIYTPKSVNTSNIGGNTVTVKDFNVNLNGTIKLDGGSSSSNIDVRSLLNDHQFVNSLKQIIKESINSDMNGGRYMNDVSTLRGHTTSSSILGR